MRWRALNLGKHAGVSWDDFQENRNRDSVYGYLSAVFSIASGLDSRREAESSHDWRVADAPPRKPMPYSHHFPPSNNEWHVTLRARATQESYHAASTRSCRFVRT
jgi:hypothetical protein